MIRGRLVTAALLVITGVAMMGAEGPKSCQRQDGGDGVGKTVDTNPNKPNPRNVTYKVSIDVRVKPAVTPYEVTIEARNVNDPTQKEIIGPKPVARGPFNTSVDYNEGYRLYINVTVKTSKVGDPSDAYCIIKDGEFNVSEGTLVGRTVGCILVTQRG